MTPLGLGPDDCRAALHGYRRRVGGLRALLERRRRGERVPELPVAAAELANDLEVDVRVRTSGPAREAMTRVEAAVLAPALQRMWEFSGRLAPSFPAAKWLAPLDGIELELAAAEQALLAWERRHAPPSAG